MTGWRNTNSRNIGDLDGTDNTIAPGGSGALNDSALGAFYQLYAAQGQFPASFLSFPRHEYFRRILCGLVGGWMEAGEIPPDFDTFGAMVQDISYRNAKAYFAIPGVND